MLWSGVVRVVMLVLVILMLFECFGKLGCGMMMFVMDFY